MLEVRLAATTDVTVTTDRATARAFIERLYAAHHGEIYAYLARMVRDDELAADLTQEAFVKAYRAHDTLQDANKARAWLYQIAGRTALDELRRRKIVRFVPWMGEDRGESTSAEDTVLRGRLSADLERALQRIPPRQRQALLLAELNELTGLELAEAMGVSHVAARALLTRGRESLRQALAVERARSAVAETRRVAAAEAQRASNQRNRRSGRDQ